MVIQVGQTLNVDLHDRVMEAYYGKLGEKFMKETQKRIHWIAERVQGDRVLDVGCSQGTLAILLGREGKEVVGLDSSEKSILEAKGYLAQEEQKTQSRVSIIQSDFLSHDFKGELFDTVIIAEVLEHLVDPQAFINKAKMLLKDGGLIIVTVPFGINDFIDHKHTFYFLKPYEMLSKAFVVRDYDILGKWIGFVAENQGSNLDNTASTNVIVESQVLCDIESVFYSIERELLDSHKNTRQQFNLSQSVVTDQEVKIQGLEKQNQEFLSLGQSNQVELENIKEQYGSILNGMKEFNQYYGSSKEVIHSLQQKLYAYDQLVLDNEMCRKDIESKGLEVEKLRAKVDVLIATLAACEDRLALLSAELDSERVRFEQKETQLLQRLLEQNTSETEILKRCSYLETKLKGSKLETEQLTLQTRALQDKVALMEGKEKRALAIIESERCKFAQKESRLLQIISTHNIESSEQSKLIRLLNKQIHNTQSENRQLNQRIKKDQHKYDQDVAELSEQIEKVLEDKITVTQKYDQDVAELSEQIEKVLEDKITVTQNFDRVKSSFERSVFDIQLLNQQCEEYIKQIKEQKTNIELLTKNVADREKSGQELTKTIEAMRVQISLLQKTADQQKGLYQNKEKQDKQQISNLEKKVQSLQNTLSFQLGHTLIFGFKSWDAFKSLPIKLLAIRKLSKERKRSLALPVVSGVTKLKVEGGGSILEQENKQVLKEGLFSSVDLVPYPRGVVNAPRKLKVATILDEFSFNSFKYEFLPVVLEPENWKEQFEKHKPDLFFCESAWSGSDSVRRPWKGKIYSSINFKNENRKELLSILAYCKEKSIPTVFWNKEDPTHYIDRVHDFVKTAVLFDYVFTTAEECVESYKKDYGHDNVFALPFATQPRLFNPIEKGERSTNIVFAGSWYAQHPARCKEMSDIFNAIEKSPYRLAFYNRHFGNKDENHQIPEEYKAYELPNVPHSAVSDVYKSSVFGLNINTVTDSKTMFARRVFELMSCNTLVLSNFSEGIQDLFGSDVVFIDRDKDALQTLSNEKIEEIRERSLERVLKHHTYQNRFEFILRKVGFDIATQFSKVTIAVVVYSHEQAQQVIHIFRTIENDYELLLLISESVADINVAEFYQLYNKQDITVIALSYVKRYMLDASSPIKTDFFALIDGVDSLLNILEIIPKVLLHSSYTNDLFVSLQSNSKSKYHLIKGFVMRDVFSSGRRFLQAARSLNQRVEDDIYHIV